MQDSGFKKPYLIKILGVVLLNLWDKLHFLLIVLSSKLKFLIYIAPVAQLDRALGYGPGGSGFNS